MTQIKVKNHTKTGYVELDTLPVKLRAEIRKHAVFSKWIDEDKRNIDIENIDVRDCISRWLLDCNSKYTMKVYRIAINRLQAWLHQSGIHPLKIKPEHANDYKAYLKDKGLASNTIRFNIMACASFYTRMLKYRNVEYNAFKGISLPPREYRKRIKAHSTQEPIMNEKEYNTIMNELNHRATTKGKRSFISLRRENARYMIPVLYFLRTYGIRLGSLSSVEIHDDFITYFMKGGRIDRQSLQPDTIDILKKYGLSILKPFKNYIRITIQQSIKRICSFLKEKDLIRHIYSAHDFRHFFSWDFYDKTKDIYRLKQLLGHSNISVTDAYLQQTGIV